MRYSVKAWIGLAAYIYLVEKYAPSKTNDGEGDMLSHQYDRWLAKEPTRTIAIFAVLSTAGHLLNVLPYWMDPYSSGAQKKLATEASRLTQ
ncbi:hypothetical protein R2325_16670 [Mycobacteroides chelonae]|uniref:DUF7427 family protein n=1 Tax=Mycobacteroides chelonae TaxID=1774 RepID=UPI002DE98F35|nr:hypothetical protein [Mycobacteroides chelonae]MEC4873619.1 hypothetical protein [Mycobacteroides chelonae]